MPLTCVRGILHI